MLESRLSLETRKACYLAHLQSASYDKQLSHGESVSALNNTRGTISHYGLHMCPLLNVSFQLEHSLPST